MASSISSRPQSTPTPVGPHILWPQKAMRSAPSSATSVGRWGTYWQASTHTMAPAACAASAMRRTGLIVPSTLDMALKLNELGAVDAAVEVVEVEQAVGVSGMPAHLDAALGREHVPGHDVGVVLHLGEHDGVAGAQVGAAPRVRDEVERLGGVLGEDDLAAGVGADERATFSRAASIWFGRLLGDAVDAAVHVGVDRLVVAWSSRRARRGASARTRPSRGRRSAGRATCGRAAGSPS